MEWRRSYPCQTNNRMRPPRRSGRGLRQGEAPWHEGAVGGRRTHGRRPWPTMSGRLRSRTGRSETWRTKLGRRCAWRTRCYWWSSTVALGSGPSSRPSRPCRWSLRSACPAPRCRGGGEGEQVEALVMLPFFRPGVRERESALLGTGPIGRMAADWRRRAVDPEQVVAEVAAGRALCAGLCPGAGPGLEGLARALATAVCPPGPAGGRWPGSDWQRRMPAWGRLSMPPCLRPTGGPRPCGPGSVVAGAARADLQRSAARG